MIKQFLLLTALLLFSVDGICNSLTMEKISGGVGYIVRGKVDANMITSKPNNAWGQFYVSVHETGNNYYSFIENAGYCPDNAIAVADYINKRLSSGIVAKRKEIFMDNGKNWTATVYCMSRPGKTWSVSSTAPSPPGAAECAITYPARVSFGNMALGATKEIKSEIKISCNASADVKVSLSKDTVKLGNAEMNYYFPGNKKNHSVSVDANRPANFNVRFALEKTGNSLGYKTGDAVMIFSWQ